jgi:catechol 2,3-dioxygenase-like lactoylglutathione lyase family enzyme
MKLDPRASYGIGIGLHVRALAVSLGFYRDVLGCTVIGEIRLPRAEIVALSFGNSMIKLLEHNATPQARNPDGLAIGLRYLTFHVRDPDELVAACRQGGFTVLKDAYDFSPSVRNAIVADPDGNIIELCHGEAWVPTTG